MTIQRKYFRKDQACAMGLHSKKDLKSLFRLKPAPNQLPAGEVWQGHGAYNVYDKSLCVAMRPYIPPTTAQLQALSAGREMIGTIPCGQCKKRIYAGYTNNLSTNLCDACEETKRRQECINVAKRWFDEGFYVLDLETTGLGFDARVVEIALVDSSGETLLDTLVNPCCPIPAEAAAIHGITDKEVANAPLWTEVYKQFETILTTAPKPVVIYNAEYDSRIISQSCNAEGLPIPEMTTPCAMLLFAKWYGELNKYANGYRWQRLNFAADNCEVKVEGEHRALADCLTTLGVLQFLSKS